MQLMSSLRDGFCYGENNLLKLQVLILYIISIPLLLSGNKLFFNYYLHPFSTISFNIALVAHNVFSPCTGLKSRSFLI